MLKAVWTLLITGLVIIGILFAVGCEKQSSISELLDGQEATEARTVQTETGGTPHHEPIQYRAQDAREAIVTPEFIPGEDAIIAGGTKGIGVTINGESRFYPLYVMQYHQVVNDTLQDCAIACSY